MLRSTEMRAWTRAFAALCKSFEPVMYEVVGDVRMRRPIAATADRRGGVLLVGLAPADVA